MLMVTGKFAISADERDEFLEFVTALVPVERRLRAVWASIFTKMCSTPNTFFMVEQWEDEAALDAYTETAAYAEHDDTLNSFVIGEPVWEEYEF